jgi:hypothetical protein
VNRRRSIAQCADTQSIDLDEISGGGIIVGGIASKGKSISLCVFPAFQQCVPYSDVIRYFFNTQPGFFNQ